ncbi:MAG: DUF1080 domain-containing protein [Terracidiphilus sp.]|nr:DUF1080 domain-containing protein [Terracidiphilus sp.]
MPMFNGTGLEGWQSLGAGNWQAQNGELVGTATSNTGGWLFANNGYQDFVLRVSFECTTCNTGVVVRAAKSGANMTGIYIPLGGPQMGKLYRATLTGADDAPTIMKPMPSPPPPPGFQGAIDAGSCAPADCDGVTGAHGGAEGGRSMRAPRPVQLHSGWNQLAVTMRGDVIIAGVNGTPLAQATMDNGPWYGQIALRTAGGASDPVHFRDVTIKDLTLRTAGELALYTDPNFTRDQPTPWFFSEGITAGDLYHNGHMDVVSGPFIYSGPDFTQAREFFPPETYDVAGPQDGYVSKSGVSQAGAIVHGHYSPVFMEWVYDFSHDGWPDVLAVLGYGPRPTFQLQLFLNPHGQNRDWTSCQVYPIVTNEYDLFLPNGIDGSGTPQIAIQTGTNPDWSNAQVGYLTPDMSNPCKPWKFTAVSEPMHWGGHGMGVGDVLGNGRLDILTYDGWWEQPVKGTPGLWKFHPQKFGETTPTALTPGQAASCFACGGARMRVYDVNGDGLPDVITSLNAHGPGLGWFEQQRDAQGNVTWKEHIIMGDPNTPMADRGSWEETDKSAVFTELHAIDYADMNGDGLPDIITGKRYYSHGFRYEENDLQNPAVIYWFELRRLSGAGHNVQWIPHEICNACGVGTDMLVTDVNGDGRPDVLAASRYGTFIFFNNIMKTSK